MLCHIHKIQKRKEVYTPWRMHKNVVQCGAVWCARCTRNSHSNPDWNSDIPLCIHTICLTPNNQTIFDYSTALISARCSWNLHPGCRKLPKVAGNYFSLVFAVELYAASRRLTKTDIYNNLVYTKCFISIFFFWGKQILSNIVMS